MYYKKLEKIVLQNLINFETDLIKHDKRNLKNYKGSFLYGYRTMGTNLLLLDANNFYLLEDIEKQIKNKLIWVLNNSSFLYGKEGKIIEISREDVKTLASQFMEKELLPLQEKLKKLNITTIIEDIVAYRASMGKLWKSKLVESWKYGDNSSSLQNFKNRFGFKVLREIKFSTNKDEIKAILCKNAIKFLS